MYEEKPSMYLLDGGDLKEILQDIIREEFKILEEKLNRETKILSREKAAEKLGVSANTISNWVKIGKLKNRGKGRHILILESDLDGLDVKHYSFYNLN